MPVITAKMMYRRSTTAHACLSIVFATSQHSTHDMEETPYHVRDNFKPVVPRTLFRTSLKCWSWQSDIGMRSLQVCLLGEKACWHDALSACAWTCGDTCVCLWVFFHSQILWTCWQFILKETTRCKIGVFTQFLTEYLWPKQHYLPTSMAEQVQQTADDTVQGLSEAANRLKGSVPNTWNWVSGSGQYINESHIPHFAVTNTILGMRNSHHTMLLSERILVPLFWVLGFLVSPFALSLREQPVQGDSKSMHLLSVLWVKGAPSACQGSLPPSIIVPCYSHSFFVHTT